MLQEGGGVTDAIVLIEVNELRRVQMVQRGLIDQNFDTEFIDRQPLTRLPRLSTSDRSIIFRIHWTQPVLIGIIRMIPGRLCSRKDSVVELRVRDSGIPGATTCLLVVR